MLGVSEKVCVRRLFLICALEEIWMVMNSYKSESCVFARSALYVRGSVGQSKPGVPSVSQSVRPLVSTDFETPILKLFANKKVEVYKYPWLMTIIVVGF